MASSSRIWEIDFVRGLAIILMVIFHTVVDLTDFFGYDLAYLSGPWYYVGKLSAVLFIIVAGISATLNHHNIRHGLTIWGWALVITAATYIYNAQTFIRFGILHLLGTSMISYAYLPALSTKFFLTAAAAITLLSPLTDKLEVATSCLLPLGLTPPGFVTIDYYPLLPWFGIFLVGVAVGKQQYQEKCSRLPHSGQGELAKFLRVLGRHSLPIYLIHQPILLLLLSMLHGSWR